MTTSFLGLRTAIYRVSNLLEATAWYEDLLGIKPYFNEPFYVGFNVAGYELGLTPDDDISPEKQRSVETYWGVEDIQAEYDRLLEHGASPCEPPTNVGGGILVATVYDPWGNLLGIIYNPHFSLVG
jgi:predicted enzyme related to lactoylglutathione lyase